jgi:hypothetical protein
MRHYIPKHVTSLTLQVLTYTSHIPRLQHHPQDKTPPDRKNREFSTDIQHETGQPDTIKNSRTQANQTSISEIRDLLSQCNSYSDNVNT